MEMHENQQCDDQKNGKIDIAIPMAPSPFDMAFKQSLI